MVYKFFDKKSTWLAHKSISGGAVKNKNISNTELDKRITEKNYTNQLLENLKIVKSIHHSK